MIWKVACIIFEPYFNRSGFMISVKKEAIRAITSLPDDAPIDDVMYRLYVIDKVSRGQSALKEGRTITTEELLKELESW